MRSKKKRQRSSQRALLRRGTSKTGKTWRPRQCEVVLYKAIDSDEDIVDFCKDDEFDTKAIQSEDYQDEGSDPTSSTSKAVIKTSVESESIHAEELIAVIQHGQSA